MFYAAFPDVAPANVASFKCSSCNPAVPEACESITIEETTKCPDGWLPFCFVEFQNMADGSTTTSRGWSCTHPGAVPLLQP